MWRVQTEDSGTATDPERFFPHRKVGTTGEGQSSQGGRT